MFCKNVDLKDYHTPISTGIKTAKGGTAIYVLKKHDLIETYDLKSSNIERETTWVEIKNKKSKNIIIGCSYRPPHYNNIADITIQKLYKNFQDVNDSYNDFIFRLEGCVNRHGPIKK